MSTFRTPNLPLAAFLRTRGANFVRYERQGRVVYFIFEDWTACDLLRSEYLLGNPTEKVFMTYFDQLRDMIHAG